MIRGFLKETQPTVFLVSGAGILLFVIFGVFFTDAASSTFSAVQSFIADTFSWFYILSTTVFLIFVIWLAAGRFGKVKLGKPDSEPEFSYGSWFAMLFSAGMGIGLVYWGVAEPLLHYITPPGADPETPTALRESMRFTLFHWGLHPWAIYIVVALPLAYFHFRHDLPMTPRSIFYPILGDRIYGPIGHGIDILTIVATLFGIATSLGLGVMQVNTGLSELVGMPQGTVYQILLIAGITTIATISVVTGLKGGIKRISEANMSLAGLLLLFVLIAGPTIYILELLVSSMGDYIQNLPYTSFWVNLGTETGWQADWTIFYWGWWISWAPFVGIFVARISKGRTVREFIMGVLLVPTALTFLWFAVFGGFGLYLEQFTDVGIGAITVEDNTLALYTALRELPWTTISSAAATLVVILFFVTSSDSGSLVIDMISSGGNAEPPVATRIFWALLEGVVAAVLLLAGGLDALQTAAISTGFPMAILLLVMMYCIVRAFSADLRVGGPEEVPSKRALRVEGAEESAD